ncbi:hypothetical protein Gogos_006202, partial [Gossypium gossypioides]|nr:hypothetical protein [Gossypium gossypioides]
MEMYMEGAISFFAEMSNGQEIQQGAGARL